MSAHTLPILVNSEKIHHTIITFIQTIVVLLVIKRKSVLYIFFFVVSIFKYFTPTSDS